MHLRGLAPVTVALLVACGDARDDAYRACIDLEPWIAALGSEDLFEHDDAVQALMTLKDAAVPALAAALEGEPAAVRGGAVEALRGIGGPHALVPLLRAARDDDAEVRTHAVASFADFDDARATAVVETALADPIPDIRQAAAAACRSACRNEPAFRRLVELALDPNPFTVAETARNSLHHAVATRPAVRAIVQQAVPTALAAAATPMARLRAGLLLADMRDPRAVAPLLDAVEAEVGTPVERFYAVAALGTIETPAAVAALARIAAATDLVQRNAACGALGALAEAGTAGATDALASCPSRVPKLSEPPPRSEQR